MIFLNPALLFGLLAAFIPLLIHLFNKRKVKEIEFSTLMFLEKIEKSKIRKIKIKQWLLLLLRTLIIVFLVLAFARPTLSTITFSEGRSAANAVQVFLLDDTYSMSAVTKNGSKFNQARLKISDLVKEARAGDEFSLVTFTGKTIAKTKDSDDFLRSLETLQISNRVPKPEEAFQQAGKIISTSKNFNKEIFVFSDLQKNIFINKKDVLLSADSNIKLFLFELEQKSISNIAIEEFELASRVLEIGKSIEFNASIINKSDFDVTNKIVSLIINGTRKAQGTVSIKKGKTARIDFSTILDKSGFADVVLELEDDDINTDNQRHLAFFVPEKVKTLVFYDLRDDIKFLEIALGHEVASGNIDLTFKPNSQAASININNYDVIFFVGFSNAISLENFNWLKEKNSFVFFPAANTTVEQFNLFLQSCDIPAVAGLINFKDDKSIKFDDQKNSHQLFREMFLNNGVEFNSPEIKSYFRIKKVAGIENIISLENNDPFLFEKITGNRGPAIFTVTPGPKFSDFPFKGIYSPLINRLVYYLSSNNNSTNVFAGNNVAISSEKFAFNLIKIVNPRGFENIVNADSIKTGNTLVFDNLDLTGNYKVFDNDKLIDYFSVNVDPSESELEFLEFADAKKYFINNGFKGSIIYISGDQNYNEVINQSRFGTELWKYLILLALLAALLEMFVSKSARKDFEELKG